MAGDACPRPFFMLCRVTVLLCVMSLAKTPRTPREQGHWFDITASNGYLLCLQVKYRPSLGIWLSASCLMFRMNGMSRAQGCAGVTKPNTVHPWTYGYRRPASRQIPSIPGHKSFLGVLGVLARSSLSVFLFHWGGWGSRQRFLFAQILVTEQPQQDRPGADQNRGGKKSKRQSANRHVDFG